MKKSMLIAGLVVILISGVVGLSTVFADSPNKGGPNVTWDGCGNVVMETGTDTVESTGGSTTVVQVSTTDTVHVSLTVAAVSMDNANDSVKVLIGLGDTHVLVEELKLGNLGPKTIEFDATPAVTGLEYTWGIWIYDTGAPALTVYYNYTMTYPKP